MVDKYKKLNIYLEINIVAFVDCCPPPFSTLPNLAACKSRSKLDLRIYSDADQLNILLNIYEVFRFYNNFLITG